MPPEIKRYRTMVAWSRTLKMANAKEWVVDRVVENYKIDYDRRHG